MHRYKKGGAEWRRLYRVGSKRSMQWLKGPHGQRERHIKLPGTAHGLPFGLFQSGKCITRTGQDRRNYEHFAVAVVSDVVNINV